ncbi:MAG: hypothetical protein SVO26_06970, partial [Chloroflexota bacterium]|nr:hypothetical protein [Chloroflexota bacterium]
PASAGVAVLRHCKRSEAISLLTPHDCFVAPLLAKTIMNSCFHRSGSERHARSGVDWSIRSSVIGASCALDSCFRRSGSIMSF